MTLWRLGLVMALALAMAAPAAAQTLEEEQAELEGEGDANDDTGADLDDGEEEGPDLLGDEQAQLQYTTEDEVARSSTDPFEVPDQDYFFLGAFGRWYGIPRFLQNLFIEDGVDANNPGVGLEFTWRKNNFSVGGQVWWALAQGEGFYRASGDPLDEQEFIDIDLGVVFVSATFLWAFPFTDWFALELGFDLGVGFIYGDLVRTEAHGGPGNWEACNGPGDPDPAFCEDNVAPDPCWDTEGGHYACNEPNWLTSGGDVPFIFPWIALPHVALRFKPISQVQLRVEGGYNVWGFFAGGSAAYGF